MNLRLLYDEFQIRECVKSLAELIIKDFKKKDLVVIGLLKGSFIFMADLVRELYRSGFSLLLDFMTVSSYGSGTEPSGRIELIRDISTEISGKQVLLVDDILDTGTTLNFVAHHLKEKSPSLFKTCVLLDKPSRRSIPFRADYVGFVVPDEFIVGYGLDYDNKFRELPHISAIIF